MKKEINIADTLIDISKESNLNISEKASLKLIARDVRKLISENEHLKKELELLRIK